jgi:hypothetical protein
MFVRDRPERSALYNGATQVRLGGKLIDTLTVGCAASEEEGERHQKRCAHAGLSGRPIEQNVILAALPPPALSESFSLYFSAVAAFFSSCYIALHKVELGDNGPKQQRRIAGATGGFDGFACDRR